MKSTRLKVSAVDFLSKLNNLLISSPLETERRYFGARGNAIRPGERRRFNNRCLSVGLINELHRVAGQTDAALTEVCFLATVLFIFVT